MRRFMLALPLVLAACQAAPSNQAFASASSATEEQTEPEQQDHGEWSGDIVGFAQAACGGCHSVGASGLSPNVDAPAFADIAQRPGLTDQTLSAWLRDAHNYPEEMDFDLDSPQVDDLAAYILALRDGD